MKSYLRHGIDETSLSLIWSEKGNGLGQGVASFSDLEQWEDSGAIHQGEEWPRPGLLRGVVFLHLGPALTNISENKNSNSNSSLSSYILAPPL